MRASAEHPQFRTTRMAAALLLVWASLTALMPLAATPGPSLEDEIRALTLNESDRDSSHLERDERLQGIARDHSAAMYEQRMLGHELADGVGPAERVAHQHRTLFALIAENVAFQQNWPPDADLAGRLVHSWMESPGHRRNILAPYELLEIGCHGDDSIMFCTQLFASSAVRLANDVPFRHTPGSELTIRITTGRAGAHRVSITPAGESPRDSGVPLDTDAARLSLPAPTGLYELHLWTEDPVDSLRYEVVGGPFVCVTRAPPTEADCGV